MNKVLRIMFNSKLHQNNKEYIRENEETIEELNRKALLILNIMYTMIIAVYYFIEKAFFSYLGADHIYISALALQIVLMFVFYFLCKETHKIRTTNIICAIFQAHVMLFVICISVLPAGIDLPAVYFAPAAIGFSVLFIFPWNLTFGLFIGEIVVMLIMSGMVKSPQMFGMDICSGVFAFVVAVFFAYMLNVGRTADSRVRKEMKLLNAIDKLTQLNNKSSAEMLCREYIEGTDNPRCALLVIDFDDFKQVNDSFGHRQGDKVLAAFGDVIKDVIRKDDIAGRIGGDEFIVLLKDCDDLAAIRNKANLILENTHRIMANEVTYKFTCSIGITVLKRGEGVTTYGKMFSKADRALYIAKKRGRDCSYYYSDGTGEEDNEKKKIIIVDDQEVSRAVLRSCFEETYDIIEAENGREALEFMELHYDTIVAMLLDIEMPIVSGFEVLKEMQSNRKFKKIPVLIVTGDEGNELEALEMGATDIVTKPFDPKIVAKRVENAIRRSN